MDVGLKRGDVYLGTRKLPNRKQASLVIEIGNAINVIGTVKFEDLFEKYLTYIMDGTKEEYNRAIDNAMELIKEMGLDRVSSNGVNILEALDGLKENVYDKW